MEAHSILYYSIQNWNNVLTGEKCSKLEYL